MSVPYSASELLTVARNGNGQDVLNAVEAMSAAHGPAITALMVQSVGAAIIRDRFCAPAGWNEPRPAMHWTPPDGKVRTLP